jgi:hypothetical protein
MPTPVGSPHCLPLGETEQLTDSELFVFTSGSMKLDPPRDLRFGTLFNPSETRGRPALGPSIGPLAY